jgi:putative cell wall-binding protein
VAASENGDSGCNCLPTEAILASGEQFADALAAGAIAVNGKALLLTARDALPASTMQAIHDWGIFDITIVGGTAAVSEAVEQQVRAECAGHQNPACTVRRLFGANREGTAVAIAEYCCGGSTSPSHVNLARGDDFPDALAGGPHAASENAPILLTLDPTHLSDETRAFIHDHNATIDSIHVFGDNTAVSDGVVADAQQAAAL